MMRRLLIVDDEEMIVSQMERMFYDKFRVFTANYAGQAVEVLKDGKIDIVILDIKMGPFSDRSGLKVLEKLRENNKNTEVIIVSAIDDQEVIDQAHRLGISIYLRKPFHPNVLTREVEKLVS